MVRSTIEQNTIPQFKDHVKKSFLNCKTDIDNLRELIYHQSEVINELVENSKFKDKQISQMNEQILEMKELNLDLSKQIKELSEKFKSKFENVQQEKKIIIDEHKIEKSSKSLSSKSLKPKDSYEALLEFKAKVNKREVLKQKLISIIPKDGMLLSEVKFLFVEHFKYTSKATFYNYLKELELSRKIRVEREDSKNMIYVSGDIGIQISSQSQSDF